ncbi:MAG: glucokinase [Pyrinomonadaceae bacterium]
MIIAGDIGGTKTNVALFESDEKGVGAPLAQKSFPSAQYDSLDAILKQYVEENAAKNITHACFGIAGPVVEGRVETPNLAWIVESKKLATQLGVERVKLINDLEATAAGIEALQANQLFTLNEGDTARGGNRALIAAGTGLGMAGIILRENGRYQPLASEGGHMDFAPRNEMEMELLRYLFEKFGAHVSYERALSGPGLFNVYSFLRDKKHGEEPDWLRAEIEGGGNKTAAVSGAALSGKSELAVKALDLFTSIYGAMAGNLSLMMVATGGLYMGGGIAPKIIEKLKDGTFMAAFKDKGRFNAFNAAVPVHVILDDKTALYGAARSALY